MAAGDLKPFDGSRQPAPTCRRAPSVCESEWPGSPMSCIRAPSAPRSLNRCPRRTESLNVPDWRANSWVGQERVERVFRACGAKKAGFARIGDSLPKFPGPVVPPQARKTPPTTQKTGNADGQCTGGPDLAAGESQPAASCWPTLPPVATECGRTPVQSTDVYLRPEGPGTEPGRTKSMQGLEPAERRMVVLRLQGYNIFEIAAETHCGERTVYRVLKRVRQQLERWYRDSTCP